MDMNGSCITYKKSNKKWDEQTAKPATCLAAEHKFP